MICVFCGNRPVYKWDFCEICDLSDQLARAMRVAETVPDLQRRLGHAWVEELRRHGVESVYTPLPSHPNDKSLV